MKNCENYYFLSDIDVKIIKDCLKYSLSECLFADFVIKDIIDKLDWKYTSYGG